MPSPRSIDTDSSAPLDLVGRYGSAKHPGRAVAKSRPDGAGDDLVAAVGKLTEALETVEHARGHLLGFHRLSGTADRLLGEAVDALRQAGQADIARQVEQALVGRDVSGGMWTFQLVESYDSQYWTAFRGVEQEVRERLMGGTAHVFEAEMKAREQTPHDD